MSEVLGQPLKQVSFNEQWVHVGQDTKHGALVSLYKILINFKFIKINMWTMASKFYTDRIETKCVTSKRVEWGKRKTKRREKYQIIKGNKDRKKQTLKRNWKNGTQKLRQYKWIKLNNNRNLCKWHTLRLKIKDF